MRRFLKYLSVFCCSLLLVIFFGQITGYTPAQTTSREINIVNALAYSSDGKLLASGFKDGRLGLLDTVTSTLTRTLSSQTTSLPITGVAFKPKSNILASVSRNSTLQLWDSSTGKQISQLTGHENPPRAVAFSPDGSIVATAGEDTRVAVWDASTGKLIRLLEGHRGFINGLAFSPDGTTIASASSDRRINLWSIKAGTLIQTLRGHADAVNKIAFSPDGKTLVSASDDGSVRFWNPTEGTQRQILEGTKGAVKAIAFSPDGRILAAGGENQQISLWDGATGKLITTVQDDAPITDLAFNPAIANTLASSDAKGNVTLWDTSTGRQKSNLLLSNLLSPITTTLTETTDTLLGKALKVEKEPDRSVQQLTVNPSDQTLMASIPPAQGGPILVVTSSSNKFGNYYAEILRTEGLNEFSVSDISAVTATTLNNYDLVLLANMTLTQAQVDMFTDWVNGGGNLIAMRPDKKLASLLGLTDAGTTLANGYLLVDTSKAPGKGIVNQTIQFHDTADRYSLNGADSIATLYTNATTATTNPAVTLHNVGSSGGKAAAFTYDLARSIIYTRQGNPAWAGQERDGCTPIRSDDMFYGGASNCGSNTSSAQDWVNLNKVAIPQADEQQRLLANLILEINLAKKPLPRFWYFPHSKKAVVLMSGDDHANGGTAGRFNQFKAQSPAGCSVDDWQCIRGTSYIYPNSPLTNTQANQYVNIDRGFEVALHVDTGCADYGVNNPLNEDYTNQLSSFGSKYTSIEAPKTQRHHCLVWSDWSTTPEVELSKGIRLDTTYYYWPPSWITDRPGFFTGSGMTMRLVKQDGTVLDVFKSATQLTDESGQSFPYNIDTLLDRALGSEGYYGIFNVNAHTDNVNSYVSDAVVTSAKTRGVPVISARQLLTWLDGRDNSYFSSVSWSIPNNTLSFSITKGTGTNGLQAMLPTNSAYGNLTTVTRNGSAVTYTTSAIKGIEYAFFSGDAGSYVATYVPDTTPPQVDSKSPDNGATNISIGTSVTVAFNEAIDPATINSTTFELRNSTNALVAASYTYNEATRTAVLTPNASLATNTTYTVTLKGGATDPRIKDLAGNALAANVTWSFTTSGSICSSSAPCTIWGTSTPATPSNSDTNAVELGVKFRANINGSITGIRFYKGNTIAGNYTVNLWNTNGQNIGTATVNNLSTSGWRQVNFTNPVTITAGTTYVASYHTSIGRYAINNNYFTTNFNNGPLTALSSSSSGGNGVYKYATTGFPTDSYLDSNYWVDVAFTTAVSDTTPPTVTTTTPTSGATGVSISTTVQATFSEAMNAGTIGTTTFELRDPSNNLVPATVTYNAANFTATLTPTSSLANSTVYTATIKGGSSGVKDQANNALAADYTWSFTTASATGTCPQGRCTIWNSTTTPEVITDNDSSAVTLGVKFRSNVNGYIKGIRFYKGPQNTGTHTGNLWSSTGSNLAQATFSNETSSGWQEVTFSSPVQINADTVYIASYHTTTGKYSKNNGYFAASGVDNLPLRALSDGESGPNGVYNYGSSPAFPDSTWNSTNYWVDVVFDTAP